MSLFPALGQDKMKGIKKKKRQQAKENRQE
jgi:hypothetical protein